MEAQVMRMENPLLLPPLTLAYLGDAVYELWVRQRLLEHGHVKVNDLHRTAVRYVSAGAQARALTALASALSEQEADVARRGRNAKGHQAPKGSDAAEYSTATAFETLIGFLHLAGREERLEELLSMAAKYLEGA